MWQSCKMTPKSFWGHSKVKWADFINEGKSHYCELGWLPRILISTKSDKEGCKAGPPSVTLAQHKTNISVSVSCSRGGYVIWCNLTRVLSIHGGRIKLWGVLFIPCCSSGLISDPVLWSRIGPRKFRHATVRFLSGRNHASTMRCEAKWRYLVTLQVSRNCVSSLQSSNASMDPLQMAPTAGWNAGRRL